MIFSNRYRIFTILAIIFSAFSIQSQDFSGRIISTKGGESIPFANVLVKGTTIGVATDMNGEFTISIPSEYNSHTLLFSAVGYSNKEMPISEMNPLKINIIPLSTQEYNIDEVDVEAESKVLYGALKKCNRKIKDNYITSPYSCDFTYTHNGRSATGTYTDKTGYQRSTFALSYKNIAYQFNTNDKQDNLPYFSGRTNMEDLLSFDIVRTVGNVLDEQNVYDFELKLKKTASSDFWVIQFHLPQPQLYNTGDAHAVNYEGEIHVNKSSFAVSKVIIKGLSGKRSIHGRQVYVNGNSSNCTQEVQYTATCTYTQKNGNYRLAKIELEEDFKTKSGKTKTAKSSLVFTKQKAKVAEISGRDYFVKSL